ncbi:sialic acid binding Ig-like lectin 15, like [Paramisgurnus dabryanus]|uniref:sialic acid binding Ig-like lectin 15, like n=1 Tax=Paramisgurnus dabryanus TaxID=90735 RepID=UPI0031F3F94C
MQDFVFVLLSVLCTPKGLTGVNWNVVVQPQVNGFKGQNVILPCVFTHPKQATYTSKITVKWIQHRSEDLIFHCSLQNQTDGQNQECYLTSPMPLWLSGNPRKGNLSLGISDSQFTDNKRYICRVELDYESYQSKISTLLNITGPAEILNLTLDSEATSKGGLLKCIARGNPVPSVKWTSLSGSLGNVPVSKTDQSNYTVISSIPFSGQDVYTCQAVNSLGQAERTFPPNQQTGLVWISVFGCLLLLGLFIGVGVVVRKRRRAMPQNYPNYPLQMDKSCIDQVNKTPVYANVSIGERRLPPEIPVKCLDETTYGYSDIQKK